MVQNLLKASAVLAIGSFAFVGTALAVPKLPSNDNFVIFVQAGDMENEEVQHDLNTDMAPPPSEMEKGEGPAMKPKDEGASGDIDMTRCGAICRPTSHRRPVNKSVG